MNVRPTAVYRQTRRSGLQLGIGFGGHLELTDFHLKDPSELSHMVRASLQVLWPWATVPHIIDSCPLTKLDGGRQRLYTADEAVVVWHLDADENNDKIQSKMCTWTYLQKVVHKLSHVTYSRQSNLLASSSSESPRRRTFLDLEDISSAPDSGISLQHASEKNCIKCYRRFVKTHLNCNGKTGTENSHSTRSKQNSGQVPVLSSAYFCKQNLKKLWTHLKYFNIFNISTFWRYSSNRSLLAFDVKI